MLVVGNAGLSGSGDEADGSAAAKIVEFRAAASAARETATKRCGAAIGGRNSAILFAVPNSVLLIAVLFVSIASVATSSQQSTPLAQPPTQPAPGQSTPQSPNAPQTTQPPLPAQSAYAGPVIVIDPAHGGTDTGARGQNGVIEKDIVLQFARVTRAELVRQGYKAVLTRDDDSNPSYDDRAAMANSYREPIFVSLHISSTGAPGTVRAYYYRFWKQLPPAAQSGSVDDRQSPAPVALAASPPATLVPWNEAQRSFADLSQRLADQLQGQMASVFPGSPQASRGVKVRGLRSLEAPAVAIEISSVSVAETKALTVFAGPLATAVVKGIQAFRPVNSPGAK